MAVDFDSLLYSHCFDTFARDVTITPTVSQPTGGVYAARGIFGTEPIDIVTENGAILSDQATILDIRESEFSVLPMQGDTILIPDTNPPTDIWEITERRTNGVETTLTIRKVMEARP